MTVAGFLVLGALVNVAVAWGCAYWIDGGRPLVKSPARGVTASRQPRWQILMARGPASTVIRSTASSMPPPPVPLPPDVVRPPPQQLHIQLTPERNRSIDVHNIHRRPHHSNLNTLHTVSVPDFTDGSTPRSRRE